MTSETRLLRQDQAIAVEAAEAALATAQQAGVTVVELHDLAGLKAAAELYQDVWRTDTRSAPVSPDLMRALSHAGGYVSGAYDGDRLVAASLAFHTGSGEAGLHSHISAVAPDLQGRDVGRALKLHQRAWALERGLRTISWTYDPLIRRNAWFNVTKLGARAIGYLVDFYGAMDDAQNAGDGGSDRAVALWDLEAPYVRDAAAGRRRELDVNELLNAGAEIGLHTDADGRPLVAPVPAGTSCVLVRIPDDIQQLRRTDPLLASRWRATSREVLEPLLAGPYVTTGFTRTGWYVLEETPA